MILKDKVEDIGIIIARFQVPYLHKGHIELIDSVAENHMKVIVLLGVSPIQYTVENPLSYESRAKMVQSYYPNVICLPLMDYPTDEEWSNNLDKLLISLYPVSSFRLYGSRDSFSKYYTGKYPVTNYIPNEQISGTEIRKDIKKYIVDDQSFRMGIIHALENQYPLSISTVDILIFNEQETKLLMGKKSVNFGNDIKYHLIGGFVDPSDESYEHAILRELEEETGIVKEIDYIQYLFSIRVNDYRYSGRNKVKTIVFKTHYDENKPFKAGDDIVGLEWVNIDDAIKYGKHKTILNKYFNNK